MDFSVSFRPNRTFRIHCPWRCAVAVAPLGRSIDECGHVLRIFHFASQDLAPEDLNGDDEVKLMVVSEDTNNALCGVEGGVRRLN